MRILRSKIMAVKAELRIRQRLYNAARRDLQRVTLELTRLEKQLEHHLARTQR